VDIFFHYFLVVTFCICYVDYYLCLYPLCTQFSVSCPQGQDPKQHSWHLLKYCISNNKKRL